MEMSEGNEDSVGGAKAEVNVICQPCLDDGQELKAHGYCIDCEEHLCEDCFSGHTKPRPMRNHRLLSATEMPKDQSKFKSRHTEEEKCSIHKDCFITSLCKGHNHFCCKKCLLTGHKTCADVKPVSQLAADFAKSEELKQFSSKINQIKTIYEKNKEQCKLNIETITKCHDNAIEEFVKYVDGLQKTDLNNMRSLQETCDSVLNEVESWKTYIELQKEKGCHENIFIRMHVSLKHFDMLAGNATTVTKANAVQKYKFEVDEKGLGNVLFSVESNLLTQVAYANAPTLIDTLPVDEISDKFKCLVRDMVLLGREYLIVADGPNEALKVIDSQNRKMLETVKLQHCPWEIAKSSQGEIFVSFQLLKANRVSHVRNPLTNPSDVINLTVGGNCRALQCVGNSLLVQLSKPSKLIQTDFKGNLINTIQNNVDFVLDDYCSHSVFNPYTNSLLLTSTRKQGITEITMDGKIELKYATENMNGLAGIVVDVNGALFVCNERRKCVTRITVDGDIHDVITNLSFKPHALALDEEDRKLYVGGFTNSIYVYAI